jgi:hypothetical protein
MANPSKLFGFEVLLSDDVTPNRHLTCNEGGDWLAGEQSPRIW